VLNILLKKSCSCDNEVTSLVEHYKVEVMSTMQKSGVEQLVTDHLIDEELVFEDDLESARASATTQNIL